MKPQPMIEKDLTGYWTTTYPIGTENHLNDFYDAVEIMDDNPKKAEKIFKNIITYCGNGQLDAILHLGFLLMQNKKHIEGNALINKAYRIAIEAFPSNFKLKKDKLEWGDLNNRPIMRSIHAFGLELMKEQNFEKALKVFEFNLQLNPQDHQGIRFLILDCLFELKRPNDVLLFAKKHSDDDSVDFLYGKFLALYLLNKKDEAVIQLIKAKNNYPFVAEELIKIEHAFPHDEVGSALLASAGLGYADGSRTQAYYYWSRTRYFWYDATGVKELISILLTQQKTSK